MDWKPWNVKIFGYLGCPILFQNKKEKFCKILAFSSQNGTPTRGDRDISQGGHCRNKDYDPW